MSSGYQDTALGFGFKRFYSGERLMAILALLFLFCRLIVVAEKEVVYEKFPIPLINRLEKHFLTVNTLLTREQHKIVGYLKKWTEDFVKQKRNIFEHPRLVREFCITVYICGRIDSSNIHLITIKYYVKSYNVCRLVKSLILFVLFKQKNQT